MIVTHSNQPCRARQWVAALCLCAVTAWGQEAATRVLDRAVASIEGRVITQTQLDFEARVLLVDAGGVTAAQAPLDEAALRSGLEAIIDQRLATLEADKLEAYPLEAGELEKAIAAFRARFESELAFARFLARHEAELVDLADVLRRSRRAQRVLEGKLRLKAQVPESEVRRYRLEHPEFAEVPPDALRQRLVALRFSALVKEELAALRRQVDVRLLGPWAPGQGGR